MSTPPAIPFGALLRQYRRTVDLTQEALAERCGLSVRSIRGLERGANLPPRDSARRLAEALGLGERERALLLTAAMPAQPDSNAAPAMLVQPGSNAVPIVPVQLESNAAPAMPGDGHAVCPVP